MAVSNTSIKYISILKTLRAGTLPHADNPILFWMQDTTLKKVKQYENWSCQI